MRLPIIYVSARAALLSSCSLIVFGLSFSAQSALACSNTDPTCSGNATFVVAAPRYFTALSPTWRFFDNSMLSLTGGNVVDGGRIEFYQNSILNVGMENALGTSGTIVFNNMSGGTGGIFRLNGYNTTVGTISSVAQGSGVITNDGADNKSLTVHGDAAGSVFSGKIQNGSGTGTLGLTLAAGDLTLSGANTYTGGTKVLSGVLRAGSAGAFVANTAYVLNGGTLDLGGYDLVMSSLAGTGGTLQAGTASLTVNQNVNTSFAGSITGSGQFIKGGSGELVLSGNSSDFAGSTTVTHGNLKITGALGSSEGAINAGSASGAAVNVAGQNAQWIIENNLTIGGTGSGTLVIENGGTVSSQFATISSGSGTASAIVRDSGSVWSNAKALLVGTAGTGKLSILNGGSVSSEDGYIGQYQNNSGEIVVSGAGSTWSNSGFLRVGDMGGSGSLTIDQGAVVYNKDSFIGSMGGSTGAVTVSGAGSVWHNTGELNVGFGMLFNYGAGTLTIADRGEVIVGAAGSGAVFLGKEGMFPGFGTSGTLNIGASTGNASDAVAAGALNASAVEFGKGSGTLNFNHTDANYNFSSVLKSTGQGIHSLNQIAGTTILTADNSAFRGNTTVSGGKLIVGNTLGGAASVTGGTLQIGNGGTSGTIAGNINNDGILAFNRTDVATFAGNISGGGLVQHIGSGTTILSGVNNYSGGTTMRQGILQVSQDANLGAATGGLNFDGGALSTTASFNTLRSVVLSQAGQVVVADGAELGFNGQVTGSAVLYKQGNGTLLLDNAANDYGGTVVEAGTLIGNAGSVSGNIGNAGTVIFDQSADAGFNGSIAGFNGTKGSMVKRGLGMLSLDSTSSLNWLVEAGGLTTAAERFGGDVAISKDADFTFRQLAGAGYGGAVSGAGHFVKADAGQLLLTGDSSAFTGTTTIAEGLLTVNGKLGGTALVGAGGKLGGSGTVGSGAGSVVTVASGGVFSPGNSIGTLSVDGDLVFEAGSRFEVEVNPQGTESDLVHVTGTAYLNGGAVAHIGAGGHYNLRSDYTILAADVGLNGTFDAVTSDFAFLTPELSYDYAAHKVDLKLNRNDTKFADKADTHNRTAVAAALDGIGMAAANPVYDAVALLPDDRAIIGASLDQLSGEVHASAKTALIDDSFFVREAANTRVRTAFSAGSGNAVADTSGRFEIWGQGFGSWGKNKADGNAAKLTHSVDGFLAGADTQVFDNWRLGMLTGYSQSRFDMHDRNSSGSSDNYHLGIYGGSQFDNLGLRTGLAYSWHSLETSRNVIFGNFSDKLSADYNAGTFQAFGELGYRIDTGIAAFEPFVNLAHVNLQTRGFSEQGGSAGLHAGSQTTNTTFTTLGVRASTQFELGRISAAAHGTFGWKHGLGDLTPLSVQAFSAGDAFTISGAPLAKNAAVLEAGFDMKLTPGAVLGVSYQGQIASDARQHGFKANLAVRF
ncbi:autotransporter domain-containing protein [Pseudochrobactrum sp. sp1633]|uniref:autotransporter domain-containing protein n=1 Tax=Pseudochrobactrum sp. sp1633 TaxID=3036706 RepID=UPI0025A501C4|nr:autotransporter domain-containing protein [Pseudochrobactrum sp. sp1633]MDM8346874.1 autotransporter domain-containing protein [Pseudochrobactrum sp. sp1633]